MDNDPRFPNQPNYKPPQGDGSTPNYQPEPAPEADHPPQNYQPETNQPPQNCQPGSDHPPYQPNQYQPLSPDDPAAGASPGAAPEQVYQARRQAMGSAGQERPSAPKTDASAGYSPPQPPNTKATLSMIFGIVSIAVLLLLAVPVVNIIAYFACVGFSVSGLVLAIQSKKIGRSAQGTAGLVLSIVGLSLAVVVLLVLMIGLALYLALPGYFY